MIPILPRLEIPEEAQGAQLDMMKKCVMQDGELLGYQISELGISTYLKLAQELMSLLGMTEVGKD